MGLKIKLKDLETWDDLEIYCKSKVYRKFYIKNFTNISKLQDPLDLILRFFVNKETTVYKRGGLQCNKGKCRSFKEFFKIYFTYFPNNNMTDCLLSLYNFQKTGFVRDHDKMKKKSDYDFTTYYKLRDLKNHNREFRILHPSYCPDIYAYNVQNYLTKSNNFDITQDDTDYILDKLFFQIFYRGFPDIPKLNKSIRQYLKDKNEIT